MKVISGKLKGRVIKGYDINGTRPTMDRVKESLFAIIQDYIPGSLCLDLFAGSGSLGIEAISMGARKVYFVDKNKMAINTIKTNINNFNIDNQSVIINKDYKRVISELKDIKFDIIFLDPPYDTDYISLSLNLIEKENIINDNGIIVLETDNINKIDYSNNYEKIKEKKYGDKVIVILKKI